MRFSAEKGRVGDEMIEPLLSSLYSLHDGLDGLRLVLEIFSGLNTAEAISAPVTLHFQV